MFTYTHIRAHYRRAYRPAHRHTLMTNIFSDFGVTL